MGSDKDPTWWDFPQALSETQGARRYITLFEAPFESSVLNDHENSALMVGSLLAVPPLPPGSQPLAGSTTVDLPEQFDPMGHSRAGCHLWYDIAS